MQGNVKEVKRGRNQWLIVALIVVAATVIVGLLIVLPLIEARSDFDAIFEKMGAIGDPELIITDMSAENVYGNTVGEVRVISKDLVTKLTSLSDDFGYHGKDSDSLGAWDIRVRARVGDGWVEIYLDDDSMYYVRGGNYYRFVPKNEETETAYKELLDNIQELMGK